MAAESPFEVVRICSNGRTEVRCTGCNNYIWLNEDELDRWKTCPHCVGWWNWSVVH